MMLEPDGPRSIPATPYPNNGGIPIREQNAPSKLHNASKDTKSLTRNGSLTDTVISFGRERVHWLLKESTNIT